MHNGQSSHCRKVVWLSVIGCGLMAIGGCAKQDQPAPASVPATTSNNSALPGSNQAPAATSQVDQGTLVIDLKVDDPTTIVSIDGKDYLPKELDQPLSLPVGAHTVELKLDGKGATTRKLTLQKDQRLVLQIHEPNREAAEWVVKAGGMARLKVGDQERDVRNISDLPPEKFQIVTIDLGFKPVTDADLERLQGLTRLRSLGLQRTGITDVGIAPLAGLTALEGVDLKGTKITDAAVTHLVGLPKLIHLFVGETEITDSGMERLKEMKKLHNVGLDGTKITDAGLAHWRTLSNISYLHLNGTRIGDAGLAAISGFKLNTLTVARTAITDRGLKQLSGMKGLAILDLAENQQITDAGLEDLVVLPLINLNLSNTRITDAGLPHLKKLSKLQDLNLSATGITEAGLADLKAALPNCKIQK